MLCFSGNSILCRFALAPNLVDAATFTSLRVASAALVLCAAVWFRVRRLPKFDRTNPLSIVSLAAYFIFFSFAYLRLDAGAGALILIGAVQLTMFSVAFWEGERFSLLQWIGLAASLLGFICLVLPGASAPDPLGAVLMGLSGIAWGCFSLLARGASDPIETNAANLVGCLLPTALISLWAVHDFKATGSGTFIAVVSGGLATGIGYIFWYRALRWLPAAYAASVQLSMPALVAFGGIVLLSEPITLRVVAASTILLAGVGLILTRRWAPQ
jgi:drug/metabolite transporter (DMT)-like permease